MASFLRTLWGGLIWAIEKSDIIPPIIAVSAWHYAGSLAQKDPMPIAIIIGVLVDIGHYRSVKEFFRRQEWKRFAIMFLLTGLTLYFHYLWYGNIWLALAMPALIISLALISLWQGWDKQAAQMPQNGAQPTANEPAALLCVCGRSFYKQQSLAAHTRRCAQACAQRAQKAQGANV